jgi:hypothetical protein
MEILVHNRDGFVSLSSGDARYADDLANFKVDYGRDFPGLPQGIDERVYQPGVCHALKRDCSVIDGGPMPWSQGDAILAKVRELAAGKAAREAKVVPAAPPEAEQALAVQREGPPSTAELL